jgi:hypothetical protein
MVRTSELWDYPRNKSLSNLFSSSYSFDSTSMSIFFSFELPSAYWLAMDSVGSEATFDLSFIFLSMGAELYHQLETWYGSLNQRLS